MMDADDPIIGYGLNAESDPMPPMQKMHTIIEERWAMWSPEGQCLISVDGDILLWPTRVDAAADKLGTHFPVPVTVTLTYTVPEDTK